MFQQLLLVGVESSQAVHRALHYKTIKAVKGEKAAANLDIRYAERALAEELRGEKTFRLGGISIASHHLHRDDQPQPSPRLKSVMRAGLIELHKEHTSRTTETQTTEADFDERPPFHLPFHINHSRGTSSVNVSNRDVTKAAVNSPKSYINFTVQKKGLHWNEFVGHLVSTVLCGRRRPLQPTSVAVASTASEPAVADPPPVQPTSVAVASTVSEPAVADPPSLQPTSVAVASTVPPATLLQPPSVAVASTVSEPGVADQPHA